VGSDRDGRASWAVGSEGRRWYRILSCRRRHAMVRTTPEAAQHHLFLRSLAERWCNQWKGQQKQQQCGKTATHLQIPQCVGCECRGLRCRHLQ